MPFTFAHPVIVLPLIKRYRKYVSATGLIVGSIAPDFESFITFGGNKIYSHHWRASIWFDLPLALILSFVFHQVVRDQLIDNLPKSLFSRFANYRKFDWVAYFKKHIVIVLCSLYIGILSHFLWDAFTHLNLHRPNAIASTIEFAGHRVYIWLQYINSVVGLILIFVAIKKLPVRSVIRTTGMNIRYWLSSFLVAGIIGVLVLLAGTNRYMTGVYFIEAGISAALYALTIVSTFYMFRGRKTSK